MKKHLAALVIVSALAIPARAANVVIDLGDIGVLTVTDTTVAGVGILICMKAALDKYQPPAVDLNTGAVIPWTSAQYKAILIDYIAQRGKRAFLQAAQAELDARVTAPKIAAYVALVPRAP
jgi:hypothetical protein